MSAINGARALDLGGGPRVVIREQRVIVPGDVSLQPGGLILPECEHHLRVIDIVNGAAWLVPMSREMEGELERALTFYRTSREASQAA